MIWREHGQLVLLRDGGGRWRLDMSVQADEYFGQRVRVVGIRSDFDLLDVTSMTLAR